MKEFKYVIKDELGIHARPAGMLAKEAAKFKSKIEISNGVKTVEVKRLMALMGLGIKKGAEVVLTFDGEDEEEAAAAIEAFFNENL